MEISFEILKGFNGEIRSKSMELSDWQENMRTILRCYYSSDLSKIDE